MIIQTKLNMNQYISLSLEELSKEATAYFMRHRMNGGASEFDSSINDISRAIIHAFHLEHGKCFLGKVNLYDKERGNIAEYQFTAYTGQLVHNFEYAFVTSCPDEELLRLIIEYNQPVEKHNGIDAMQAIKAVFARISQVGGVVLSWA